MTKEQEFKTRLPQLSTEEEINSFALELFRYQSTHNEVYANYLTQLKVDLRAIDNVADIPFLPIRFFKEQKVIIGDYNTSIVFKSSGTGGDRSRHYVKDLSFYLNHAKALFEKRYGSLNDFHVLALLPSYLEQGESSLVAMVEQFIKDTGSEYSGFYLADFEKLADQLNKACLTNKKVLLIGVTYALLDFIEAYQLNLPELIVMETGGMKGRKKEMTRGEVHDYLSKGFGVDHIHSEYGMTELLSQAYSQENGIFHNTNWMKVFVRQINDPFQTLGFGKQGILKVMDLANIDSCAFIETQDLGLTYDDGSFEVLGRVDNSDLRGCSLMYIS